MEARESHKSSHSSSPKPAPKASPSPDKAAVEQPIGLPSPQTHHDENTSLLHPENQKKKYSYIQHNGNSENQDRCCAKCCVVL